jgi:DegV family protein with EDD domain
VLTGQILLAGGDIEVKDGEVVAARFGKASGLKGFCRLARVAQGSFKFVLGSSTSPRTIPHDHLTLMAEAIEDQHRFLEAQAELGDLACRLKVVMGPTFFSTAFTPAQQKVLECAQAGLSILATLDAVDALDGEAASALVGLLRRGFVELLPPEIKVRIVTDSTADLSREVTTREQIHVVPVSVFFGETLYKDGVDLTPGAFYKLVKEGKDEHPHTKPPTKGELQAAFAAVRGESDMIAIHVSEEMSGTVVNAREAAVALVGEGGGGSIFVVDSRHVSAGLGLITVLAARMAKRGVSAPDIVRHVEAISARTRLVFAVDSLEYLARSGRIGKAGAFFGNLLGIKPILEMQEGRIVALDKARGGRDIEAKVSALIRERVDAERPVFVAIGHAIAPVWVERLRTQLTQSLKVVEILETEIGPGVGANVGPGTVGCAVFQPTDEELALLAPSREDDEPGEVST